MPIRSDLLSPLPRTTARAAEAVFGKGNIYLTVGDQLEQLLADVDVARLDPASEQPATTLAVLALVTIFQFVEGLPDRRAIEAIRTRIDWKYALHLPLAYPGLEYSVLCRFRQSVFNDPPAYAVFQQVFNGLAQTGLLRDLDAQRSGGNEVLEVVCAISRLEQLVEAMHAVLEALAAVEPKWLLANTLPHWYERYNKFLTMRVLPNSNDEQVSLAQAIGKDALYLLEALATGGGDLARLPEVQALQQVWHRQFCWNLSEIEWRLPLCASCTEHTRSSHDLTLHL